ncbi:hypothetical protein DDE83_008510 [Stemphylium lycopersici]|uniref:RRM domain-containing protein n=1 Tax=Stemphylium lycopersici TaxID=183478 RepID=A0A364MT05_STELY|nr:hypothetical protein DDE83_008510 [Stemphylium lycopersici]
MPLFSAAKARNERLIFVKNVPTYVPEEEIAALFAPYNPISIKNVYKDSSITTIVVAFRSKPDAARAQHDIDKTRLGSAEIKVEVYEQRRSLRYIRDQGQANRASINPEKEQKEQPGHLGPEGDSPSFPPLPPVSVKPLNTGPQNNTWAHVAGTRAARIATKAPPSPVPATPTKAGNTTQTTNLPPTPTATPHIPIAVPRKLFAPATPGEPLQPQTDSSPPIGGAVLHSLGDSTPDGIPILSPATLLSPSIQPRPETEMEYKIRRWGEIMGCAQNNNTLLGEANVPVGPLETTLRIRERHCRDCVFCMKREGRWRG